MGASYLYAMGQQLSGEAMMDTFEKHMGQISLEVGSPYPRWVHLGHMNHQSNPCDMVKFPIMSIQDLRDLHYAAGRALAWFDSLGEKE